MRHLVCTLMAVLAIGFLAGCSDEDCPTCPEPPADGLYSGVAYLSMLFGFKGFYIYDTDLGQITDSVMQEGYAAGTMIWDVSPDGKYLAVSYSDLNGVETRIYDALTWEIQEILPSVGGAQFVGGSDLLLAQWGGILYRFQGPSYTVLSADTFAVNEALDYLVHTGSRSLFAIVGYHQVLQISYDSMKVTREWSPTDPATGIPIFIGYFDVHPNGQILYINGSAGYNGFFVYDLAKDSLIASYPMYLYFGEIAVTPGGEEVWVTDPGRIDIPFSDPEVGTVFIFDAYTGAYTGGISLYGYIEGSPLTALDAKAVDFSPDGSEAYISTGAIGPRENQGTILRFDARSRRLVDVIFPDIDRFPHGVVVGPKP